jgi:hypothetical protein
MVDGCCRLLALRGFVVYMRNHSGFFLVGGREKKNREAIFSPHLQAYCVLPVVAMNKWDEVNPD